MPLISNKARRAKRNKPPKVRFRILGGSDELAAFVGRNKLIKMDPPAYKPDIKDSEQQFAAWVHLHRKSLGKNGGVMLMVSASGEEHFLFRRTYAGIIDYARIDNLMKYMARVNRSKAPQAQGFSNPDLQRWLKKRNDSLK